MGGQAAGIGAEQVAKVEELGDVELGLGAVEEAGQGFLQGLLAEPGGGAKVVGDGYGIEGGNGLGVEDGALGERFDKAGDGVPGQLARAGKRGVRDDRAQRVGVGDGLVGGGHGGGAVAAQGSGRVARGAAGAVQVLEVDGGAEQLVPLVERERGCAGVGVGDAGAALALGRAGVQGGGLCLPGIGRLPGQLAQQHVAQGCLDATDGQLRLVGARVRPPPAVRVRQLVEQFGGLVEGGDK